MTGNMLTILLLVVCITGVTSIGGGRIQVCEHSRPDGRTLECLAGKKVNIITGLYGRRSLAICSRAFHWGRTNCGSSSSFNKAKQICNGKQKCYLRASNSMFGDPCFGVNKYLDVSYTCVPANHPALSPPKRTRFQVCENQARKITCPKEYQTLNIVAANFGRRSLSICKTPWHWFNTKCGKASSFTKAKQLCNGKKECYVRASVAMFGDPCWGVNKYLDVTYECVGTPRVQSNSITPFVGTWKLEYSNGHRDTYTISSDGKVTLASSGRSVYLRESDNQADFPSSDGWYKLDKLFRDAAWEYVRLNDGFVEVRHFCTDSCRATYKNSPHYCCDAMGLHIATPSRPARTYEISVKTSNKLYAGTKARVYVILYGEKGDTGKLYLKQQGNTFSQNKLDKFRIEAMDVGEITMMKVGHDNTGHEPGWHLDNVAVKVKSCTSTFPVWKWVNSNRLEMDVYPTLEKGECPGTIKKMAGEYVISYTNGHHNVYVISKEGKVTRKTTGHTSTLQSSDNQVQFPSSQGWYKSSKLNRDATWEYIRLKGDGSIEIQHFCSDHCRGTYQTLKQYCCKGTGTISVTGTDLLKKLTGEWTLSYTNGHKDVYAITKDGKVTRKTTGRTSTLQVSDNQVQFPSSQGWYKSRKLHRDTTWEYIRIKRDGTLEIQHFCTDHCPGTYQSLKQYCCKGTGTPLIANKELLKKMAGEYKLSYTNGHKDVYVISSEGKVTRKTTGRTSTLQVSDNQIKFPSSQGWFKSIKLHRDTTWEYIRLKRDGTLEIQHFCTDHCKSTYQTLKQYCCKGTGSKSTTGGSTGSICRRDFRKIGCFNRDWSKVPDLIITDLDPTHTSYTKDMNWADYAEGLHSLACRCRAKAVGHYKYFGIGFFGECVAGNDHKSLEEMFKVRNSGSTEGCVNGNMETCDVKSETECAGAEDFDFFYEIVE